MDIFEQIELENREITQIENQLFEVKMLGLHTGIDGYKSPNVFGTYRSDGGEPLGVVGDRYTPTQPKEIFKIFRDGLIENGLSLSGLKYREMKGGSKIRFTVPVGKVQFTNIRKEADESDVILNFQTGFDGLTKTTLYLSTMRMICTNGMKANFKEWELSAKNTKGNTGKILTAANEIKSAIHQIDTLDQMIKRLNNIQVNQQMIDKFFLDTLGYNQKTVIEKASQSQNLFSEINQSVMHEFSQTGSTLWGLVNGITYYTNHKQVLKKNGELKMSVDDNIFTGAGLKMNDKAQKVALALAN